MQRRIVVAVSAVLFALLAAAALLLANIIDRDYPKQLAAKSVVDLDFQNSGFSDEAAFEQLRQLSDRLGLRFGNQADAEVRDRSALENSYASGVYLVTGSTVRVSEFQNWLNGHRVVSKWGENNLANTLRLIVRQGSFFTSLLAIAALMVTLVLYWLSVKARGRSLRALGGVSSRRIHFEDVLGFLFAITMTTGAVGVLASVYVTIVEGWTFVPFYLSKLLVLDVLVMVVTAVGAAVMSVSSQPNPAMIANRDPAVKTLRKVALVLKATTFVLVLAAVAPAFTAFRNADATAEQQAQWKSLANQVTLSFPAGLGESGFQQVKRSVAETVRDAEQHGTVALSYTWDKESAAGVDFGPYDVMSLVSPGWLSLMLKGPADPRPIPLSLPRMPPGARQFLATNVQFWERRKVPVSAALNSLSFYRVTPAARLPLALTGGDLVFPKTAIVVVVPNLYDTFNDDFLASTASSSNLVFTGLGATQELLVRHGLQYKISVKYAAEEGILTAQVAAYSAWLQGVSLLALVVALIVSAFIAAFITALLRARHDFPLRLAGRRWSDILAGRVLEEWLVGAGLAVMIVLLRGGRGAPLVTAVAITGLLVSPLAHFAAARWTFTKVSLRRL